MRFKDIKIYLYKITEFPSTPIQELYESDPEDYTTEKILKETYKVDWQNMFEEGYQKYKDRWNNVIRNLKMQLFNKINNIKVSKYDISDKIISIGDIYRGLDIKNDFSLVVKMNDSDISENDIIAVDTTDEEGEKRIYQGWITALDSSVTAGDIGTISITTAGLYKFLSLTTIVSNPAISSQFEESGEITNPNVTPFADLFTGKTITRIFHGFMHNVLCLSSDEKESKEYDKKSYEEAKQKTYIDKVDYMKKINFFADASKIIKRGYEKDLASQIQEEINDLQQQIKKLNENLDEETKQSIQNIQTKINDLQSQIATKIAEYRRFNLHILLLYLWFYAYNDSPSKEEYNNHAIIAKFDLGDWKGIKQGNWTAPIVWLESMKKNYEKFYSGLATPLEKMKASISLAHYELFENDKNQLIVRPPEYNRIGELEEIEEGIINEKELYTTHKSNTIFDNEITGEVNFSKDDSNLRSRWDHYMTMPFIGTFPFRGGHFTDLNLLFKYGLRTLAPQEHPFAQNETLAGLMSALTLINENAITRTGSITVQALDKFKLGKLFYIPKYKKVGYVNDITLMFNLNSGIVEKKLSFVFVRNVEQTEKNILRFRKLPKITDISQEVMNNIESDDSIKTSDEKLRDRLYQDKKVSLAKIVADKFEADIRIVKEKILSYVFTGKDFPDKLSLTDKEKEIDEVYNINKLLINYLMTIFDYSEFVAKNIVNNNSKFRSYDVSKFPSTLLTNDLLHCLIAADFLTEYNFGILGPELKKLNLSFTIPIAHAMDLDEARYRHFRSLFHEDSTPQMYMIKPFLDKIKEIDDGYDLWYPDINRMSYDMIESPSTTVEITRDKKEINTDLVGEKTVITEKPFYIYYRNKDIKEKDKNIKEEFFVDIGDLVYYKKDENSLGSDYIITEKSGNDIKIALIENYLDHEYIGIDLDEIELTLEPTQEFHIEKLIVIDKENYSIKTYDSKTYIEWHPVLIERGVVYKFAYLKAETTKEEEYVLNKMKEFPPGLLFIDTYSTDPDIEKNTGIFSKETFEIIRKNGYLPIGAYDSVSGDFGTDEQWRDTWSIIKDIFKTSITWDQVYENYKKYVERTTTDENRHFYMVFATTESRHTLNNIIDKNGILYSTMNKDEFMRTIKFMEKKYYLSNPDEDISKDNLSDPNKKIEVYNAKDLTKTFIPSDDQIRQGNTLYVQLEDDSYYHIIEQPKGDKIKNLEMTPHLQARAIDFVTGNLLMLSDFSVFGNYTEEIEKEKDINKKFDKILERLNDSRNVGYKKFYDILAFFFKDDDNIGRGAPLINVFKVSKDVLPKNYWFSEYEHFYHIAVPPPPLPQISSYEEG